MAPADITVANHPRNPDTNQPEDRFRYLVRDALGLSWDTRDGAIFEELRRLKLIERRAEELSDEVKRAVDDLERLGS